MRVCYPSSHRHAIRVTATNCLADSLRAVSPYPQSKVLLLSRPLLVFTAGMLSFAIASKDGLLLPRIDLAGPFLLR